MYEYAQSEQLKSLLRQRALCCRFDELPKLERMIAKERARAELAYARALADAHDDAAAGEPEGWATVPVSPTSHGRAN